jgi:hypothetical protein
MPWQVELRGEAHRRAVGFWDPPYRAARRKAGFPRQHREVLFLVDGFRVDLLRVNRERVSWNRSPRFFVEDGAFRIARRSFS